MSTNPSSVTIETDEGSVEVRHDPGRSRYELLVDGVLVALTDHRPAGDDVWEFPHTFTDPAHRGHGHAERVVAFAMDDVRAQGLRVRPTCWFVAEWLDAHPAYEPLRA